MEKKMKLFAACVESMVTAEKKWESSNAASDKKIFHELRSKVEEWLLWMKDKENGSNSSALPIHGDVRYRSVLSHDIIMQLSQNHSAEDIAEFMESINTN